MRNDESERAVAMATIRYRQKTYVRKNLHPSVLNSV